MINAWLTAGDDVGHDLGCLVDGGDVHCHRVGLVVGEHANRLGSTKEHAKEIFGG